MTADQFRHAMQAIVVGRDQYGDYIAGDCHMIHLRADELLCQMLRQLGYSDTVTIYEAIPKWYS